MTIRSILFIYAGEPRETPALQAACRLAKRHRAELRILHPSPPADFADLYGDDIAALEKKGIERAGRAERSAEEIVRKLHVPFFREADAERNGELPRVLFTVAGGYVDDVVPAYGRACDLIITGRDDVDVNDDIDAILAALLHTCTPTLVVPNRTVTAMPFNTAHQTIALAWDGSAAAGRALRCLGLLLAQGQTVEVICIRPKGGKGIVCPVEDAARWLELHGYVPRVTYSGPFAMGAGDAILVNARQLNADVLVMGAYGHDHWREMLFGGATDCVLKTGEIPLLLCH